MELWNTIRSRVGQFDWRSHAPVAGSIAAHGVVGLAVAAVMASSVKPEIERPEQPPLEVALMLDSIPVPVEVRPPAPKPLPRTRAEPTDTAPIIPGPTRKDEKAATPQPVAEADSESVYIPPSPFATYAPTGGLQGLANLDPCAPSRYGPRPRECSQLAAQVGSLEQLTPRSKQELAQQHGEFMPTCAYAVGCEGGEWISTNGTRSVAGTRMAGGVESVGGAADIVGRLGFNPDHFDRGFGN